MYVSLLARGTKTSCLVVAHFKLALIGPSTLSYWLQEIFLGCTPLTRPTHFQFYWFCYISDKYHKKNKIGNSLLATCLENWVCYLSSRLTGGQTCGHDQLSVKWSILIGTYETMIWHWPMGNKKKIYKFSFLFSHSPLIFSLFFYFFSFIFSFFSFSHFVHKRSHNPHSYS
jgi:hypothetical protein